MPTKATGGRSARKAPKPAPAPVEIVPADEPLMTLQETARAIGKITGRGVPHMSAVHRWRSRGLAGHKLPTVRLLGRVFVRPADFRAFVAATSDMTPRVYSSDLPESRAAVALMLGRDSYGSAAS